MDMLLDPILDVSRFFCWKRATTKSLIFYPEMGPYIVTAWSQWYPAEMPETKCITGVK